METVSAGKEATSHSGLDRLIPSPRLREVDRVEVCAPPGEVWGRLRHADLARAGPVRALFAIRELPDRLRGHSTPISLRLDDLRSSPSQPGFQILAENPPHEIVVGAIGQVWKPRIPFVHVEDAAAFARFSESGYIKVAWALRIASIASGWTRVEIEVRVDATDDVSWRKFRRYFRVIGIGSRFIRRFLLASLAREVHGGREGEEKRPLPGDDLLPDAARQWTHTVTIHAPPNAIWPWLAQLGCRRAGYYSIDVLDNANIRSAREVHPELQAIAVGDVLPATPTGTDGFEVLRVEPPNTLVLGGLYDTATGKQLPFSSARSPRFWHVTWAFLLERLDEELTVLHVRVRGAYSRSERLRAACAGPIHHVMETAQLRHLAARVEGRLPRDDWRDVAHGVGGAAGMVTALATPFLRAERNAWGVGSDAAARAYPGDELVPEPRWGWTHGVQIDAPAEVVWPWIAQLGVGKAGFYSYQWLENLAGCGVQNAERVHPDWEVHEGDALVLHPRMPALTVSDVEKGRWFVAYGPPNEAARHAGKPWVSVSWLFLVEPLDASRCRLISRYRCACSDDVMTRLQYGATFVEPVGFAMDRAMLLGIKERVERAAASRRILHIVEGTAQRAAA